MQNQMYLTLPSNTVTPTDYVGRKLNTLNEFRVQLPHKIHLSGAWECALAEISYPNTYPNVQHKDCKFTVTVAASNDVNDGIFKAFNIECELPSGRYENEDQLVTALNEVYMVKLENLVDEDMISPRVKDKLRIRFLHQKTSTGIDRVMIKIDWPTQVKLLLNNNLRYMLGFRNWPAKMTPEIVGEFPMDPQNSVFGMYVYSDVCENSVVGNVLAPLLRVVPLNSTEQQGKLICHTFSHYQYVPVAHKEIDTITISLRDDRGRRLAFYYGKVLVVLHLRRQKPDVSYSLGV